MFSRGSPLPTKEMTSDSANTVHMLEMTVGCPAAAKRASSAWLTPNRSAMISKKRPVPAEHLSFMTNLRTLPPARPMALVSCPPISMTVPSSPKSAAAPRAWQVISVTTLFAYGTATRPYPVATTGISLAPKPSQASTQRTCSATSTLEKPVGMTSLNAIAPEGSATTAFVAVDPISMPIPAMYVAPCLRFRAHEAPPLSR